jgi:hypothetical protein
MDPQNITNPSRQYPTLTLFNSEETATIKCKNFNIEKQKIMNELNINKIWLCKQQVVLRRKKLNMPVSVVSETTTTGKFFKLLVSKSKVIFLFSQSLV